MTRPLRPTFRSDRTETMTSGNAESTEEDPVGDAIRLLRSGQPDAALNAILSARGSAGDESRARSVEASALYQLRRYSDALRLADDLLGRDPENVRLLWIKAHSLRQLGRLHDAIPVQTRVASQLGRPQDWRRTIEWLIEDGQYGEAMQIAQGAAAAHETDPRIWHMLAVVLVALKRYEEARRAATKAISLAPHNPDQWQALSLAEHGLGHYHEALDAADRAIELQPDFGDAWHDRAEALRGLGLIREAVDAERQRVDVEPNSSIAWLDLARSAGLANMAEEAVHAAQRSVELDSSVPLAWHTFAVALMDVGNREQAIEALRKRLALSPGDKQAEKDLNVAVQLYESIGDQKDSYKAGIRDDDTLSSVGEHRRHRRQSWTDNYRATGDYEAVADTIPIGLTPIIRVFVATWYWIRGRS